MATETEQGSLANVQHVILILSGKGGVGKSTVCSQLALSLRARGNKVGILDVDLCGPSIPKLLGVDDKDVHQCPRGWVPVYVDQDQTLSVMSIAFLLNSKEDAIVWRGPKKNGMIKQFIEDVYWQELDYLLIDTPPGTSDEHISTVEALKRYGCDGAVLVTTPQNLSVGDVRRELTFCRKLGLPILGIVENMSGYVCPHCQECSNVFSKGGGEGLAKEQGVSFLGCVPLDGNMTACLEKGNSFVDAYPNSATKLAIDRIVDKILGS